jgi:hypothetical protein
MKQALAVSALLWMTVLCAATETSEWGQTVDGLRLSVAILPDSGVDLQIRVTVNYLGRDPVLLPFAFAGGKGIARHRLSLIVSAADGEHTFGLDDPTIPLRGRFDPLVIPMLCHASYVLESPIAAWCRGRTNPKYLEGLIQGQGQLWVELDCEYMLSTATPPLACPLYGYPNPNAITCWQGKLTSNRLRLPR